MLNTNLDSLHLGGDSRRLQALYAVSAMLGNHTDGLDLNRILPQVLRTCVEVLDAGSASIFVLHNNRSVEHAWLIDGDQVYEDSKWPHLAKVLDRGLAGSAIRDGQPLLVRNSAQDERWIHLPHEKTSSLAPQTAISVPMNVRGHINGVINIARPLGDPFDEEDLNLLVAVADHAAGVIFNAQLYRDSISHAQELSALIGATTKVMSSLDAEHVTRIVAEQITNLLDVEAGAILEWDPQSETLIGRTLFVRSSGGNHLPKQDRLRLNTSALIKSVLHSGEPLQVTVGKPDISPDERQLLQRLGLKSMLILPMIAQNETIGLAMLMDRSSGRAFRENEVSVAQTLARQAAVSIQNARLYEEAQRQLKVTKLLNDASRVINSSLDLDEIMQSLLSEMNAFLKAEALSIALVDPDSNELVFTVAEGVGSSKIVGMRLPSNQGVTGWVMENGEAALVNDTRKDPRFHRRGDERTGHITRAIIVAPMRVKDDVLGTIQAINPIEKSRFSEADLQLLVNLANLASSAVANAQQFIRTQKAESRYMGLFQDSIDPIILTSKIGKILEVNGRACELLGYDRPELLRLNISNLHPVETGVLGERQFQPIKTRQIKMFTSEIMTRTNRRTIAEVYAKRIYVDDEWLGGNREFLQWIYHDITEEVELQDMREDLTAMLFHDLQSPLGNIIASLELVNEDLPPDTHPSLVSMVDVAMKSGQRLQRLVKSLLDINRLEAGHAIQNQSFASVLQLIDEAEETMRASLERRNIRMARDLPLFIPDIYVDADMIQRVVINLLDNALKYSQDGQIVTVSIKENVDDERLTISISDQGPGIPPEFREVIFDKFRRADDGNRRGIGLGLSFCRLAVEAHQGEIWVDSSASGGARFNFTLPIG